MNSAGLYFLLLIIVFGGYLFNLICDWFNYRYLSPELPIEMQSLYEKEKYVKQFHYQTRNARFDFLHDGFGFLISFSMLLFYGYGWLDEFLWNHIHNEIWLMLAFFWILFILSDLINLPFSWYRIFILEATFGFNKTTVRTFIFDKLKGWFLSVVIGAPLLILLFWFYRYTGSFFWVYSFFLMVSFMLFFTLFYSQLIVPLFNKQTPLPDGELRQTIHDFVNRVGFKINDVYLMDGSKRSTKANAYFTGFGKRKRIVLYDTLVNEMSPAEITAVLAHEIGHYKHKHMLKGFITAIFQMAVLLILLNYLLFNPVLSSALGSTIPSFHLSLIAFTILLEPVQLFTGIMQNMFSRKNEYQADEFARHHGMAEALISALHKLSENNLSNLNPHPLYVFVNYSHPAVIQRIRKLSGKA